MAGEPLGGDGLPTIDPNPCIFGWVGCDENYTGGHSCTRDGGHAGRHRCFCGATRTASREAER